ncbi:MAG: radical SAM protein [Candidatus Heimdallarchaeaceae archaeon]
MIIEEIKAKILVRTIRPSMFSWSGANLNPYQGCWHDCKYCDGKSEGYFMHEDFANRIKVKINAPDLLEDFLRKKSFVPINRDKTSTLADYFPNLKKTVQKCRSSKFILFIGGGVCDVYQPAEKEVKLTRKLLQIAYDYNFPVFILTKSNLVLRDLDLLKKINENTYACVNFTITLMDEKVQKIFEPKASTSEERFESIKILREEGIHSGIYFYPCLPFIGDKDENMNGIFKNAVEVKAEFVITWGLTLKPGRNKNEFMKTLRKHYPELAPKYELLYSNNSKYGEVDPNQFKNLGLIWPEIKGYKLSYENGLGYCADRYIPEGANKTNLQASEVLLKIGHLKGYILGASRQEVQALNKASMYLEKFEKDIANLSVEEFYCLPFSKMVFPILEEYLEKKESLYLKKIEKEAYEKSLNIINCII